MTHADMRFTLEQRMTALERENVVLHDKIRLLHQMLKEQRQLIGEYITQTVAANPSPGGPGATRPEEAVYAFVCKQRFDRMERNLNALQARQAESSAQLKAG